MNISPKGISLISGFEGFKAFPYQDVKGIWTIGYGTTRYPDGTPVKHSDTCISREQAMQYLEHHIDTQVIPVIMAQLLTPTRSTNRAGEGIGQNQIDALCSFIYNVGAEAFENSTLLKNIKLGAPDAVIRAGFMMWVKSGGAPVAGLVNRRKAEAQYFISGV